MVCTVVTMGQGSFLDAEGRFIGAAEELRGLIQSYECDDIPQFVRWANDSDGPDSWLLDHIERHIKKSILLVLKGLSHLRQVEGLSSFISYFGHMMKEFVALLLLHPRIFCPVETYNLNDMDAQKVVSQAWLQRVLSAFGKERISTVCNPFKSTRLWICFLSQITNVQTAYFLGVRGIELVDCVVRAVEFKEDECDGVAISLYCFLQNMLTMSLSDLLIEGDADKLLISVHQDPFYVTENFSNANQNTLRNGTSSGGFPSTHPLFGKITDTAGKLLSLPNLSVISHLLHAIGLSSSLDIRMALFKLANICQLFFQPLSVPFGFKETDLICFPSLDEAIDFVISQRDMTAESKRYLLYLLSVSFLVSTTADQSKFRETVTASMARSLILKSSFLFQSDRPVNRENVPILQFLLSLFMENDSIKMNESGKLIQLQLRRLLVELRNDYRTLIPLFHKNPTVMFDTLFNPHCPSHPEFEIVLSFWLQNKLKDVNMDELRESRQLKDNVEYFLGNKDRIHGFKMISNTLFDHRTPTPYGIPLEYDKLRSALICAFYNYSLAPQNRAIFDATWCDSFCITLLQNAVLEGSWLDKSSYTCAYFQEFLLALPNRYIAQAFSEPVFQEILLSFARRLIQKELTKHSKREELDVCCSKLRILAMICHSRKDICINCPTRELMFPIDALVPICAN